MTRFIGDSFRVTPLKLNAENPDSEKLPFISRILNERKFDPSNIPSDGWLSFQTAREDIDSDSEICSLKFSDEKAILPCTVVKHRLVTTLKRRLPASVYDELPVEIKYRYDTLDFVFFEKGNKLYALVSANNQNVVDYAINQYLKNNPFSEYGFVFDKNPTDLQIHSDLIYWILYRFFEKKQTINSNIFIRDAYLIEGNAKVPITMKYEGKDLPKYLTELKYSMCQNRPFERIGLKLDFKSHIFEFIICSDGCTEFYASDSEYLNLEDNRQDNLSKLTYIYTEIIPEIKKAYQDDKTDWPSRKKEFLKRMAIDASAAIPR